METILNVLFSGTVAACVVTAIAEHFARRRFRIDNFERLRRELQDNPKLLAVKQLLAPENPPQVALTDPEMRDYLEFFELVAVYWKKKLIDDQLLNEILADYVLDLYEHAGITDFIAKERTKLENDLYYKNFVNLYKSCDQQERQEKTLTRLNRGDGAEPRFLRRIASMLKHQKTQ
jgi:hypothetical protein